MNKKAIALDYVFLLRPSILAALWTFVMAGSYVYMDQVKPLALFGYFVSLRMTLGLIGYSLIMGSVYVLNQIRDIDTDKINKKLFLLSENIIPEKNAKAFAVFSAVTGFAVISLPQVFNVNILILSVVSYIMGLLYTVKPFEFKRKPFIDMLLNAFGYGFVAFLFGYELAGGSIGRTALVKSVPYIFSMSAVFINTTLMDYEGDKAVNAMTTGVYLGIKKALFLSSSLMFIAGAAGLMTGDYVIFSCAYYSFVFFAYAAVKRKKRNIENSVKFTSPVLTLLLGILFPQFLVISLAILASIILYYKLRFKISGL